MTAVVTEAVAKGTKQSLIAQAEKLNSATLPSKRQDTLRFARGRRCVEQDVGGHAFKIVHT